MTNVIKNRLKHNDQFNEKTMKQYSILLILFAIIIQLNAMQDDPPETDSYASRLFIPQQHIPLITPKPSKWKQAWKCVSKCDFFIGPLAIFTIGFCNVIINNTYREEMIAVQGTHPPIAFLCNFNFSGYDASNDITYYLMECGEKEKQKLLYATIALTGYGLLKFAKRFCCFCLKG